MATVRTATWELDGVEAVLFDKDGTLIDSHRYWGRIIEKRAAAIIRHYSLGPDLYEGLCSAMGFSLRDRTLLPDGPIALVSREEVIDAVHRFLLGRQVPSSTGVLADIFTREHTLFLPEMFEHIRLLPAVREILVGLRSQAVKLAVVTTDTIINTRETLRYLGIDGFFDAVIGKESTTQAKVTGGPAREALRMLHSRPEHTVSIGDAPMDLVMATNSGLKAGIGIATGQITLDRLKEYTPYVALSLGDLALSHNSAEHS
jgi:phosphoglycolate phosphatase